MKATMIPVPTHVDEVGIRRNILEDLALKHLFLTGEMSVRELADHMLLNLGIVDELFQRLRKDQLCQVTGMSGGVHHITTTSAGNQRALELLALNHYAGPTPVSFVEYLKRVCMQSVRDLEVHPSDLSASFSHMVLDGDTLNRLGTAVVSGRTIFLHGPTGTGKTTIATGLADVFSKEQVWIPYAVEVDGQIITIFDPLTHRQSQQTPPEGSDPRWVLCRRPCVVVGGELTIEMLDLQFNPLSKFYTAPVQMKANNGVLIVDDFGRQRVRAEDLLNRWVVPLDRRIDFLTMTGGKKLKVPFDLFVVFATNLSPTDLADEAFLRRIQTKIKIDYVTRRQFEEIFQRVCVKRQLSPEPGVVDDVLNLLARLGQPLRPCYPRDIVDQVCWAAKYIGEQPRLTRASVSQACRNYFISADEASNVEQTTELPLSTPA
jgi:predicted ATPase with chaperone activity